LGNIYATDFSNRRIVRFNARGNVTHIYNTSNTPILNIPRGVIVEPATGQLYVADQSANAVFVFETNIITCNTGPTGDYTDLSRLSPNGADLQGFNTGRTMLYAWSVCGGPIQDLYCAKYAPNSGVCSISLPIAKIGTVARASPLFVWERLTYTADSQQQPITGLSTIVINGDKCGRFGLASELIVLLVCAASQDATYDVDDSQVSPTSTLCLYILTLHSPTACPPSLTSSSLTEATSSTNRLSSSLARSVATNIIAQKEQNVDA